MAKNSSGRAVKIFKYALTVVGIASRFKAAEPLTSKDSSEVSKAFRKIYKEPLKWPKILHGSRHGGNEKA